MGNKQPKGEKNHPNVPNGYEEKTGTMYYKSGWMEMAGQGGFMGRGGKSVQMWIQCIHWVVYTYPEHQGWYNWGGTSGPSEEETSGMSLPSIPGLPSAPGMPSIDLPSIDMPSVDMPSVDAPSVDLPSAPSLPGAPDMPKVDFKKFKKLKKTRKKNYPYTRFEIYKHGDYTPKVKKSGKKITISGVTTKDYYEEEDEEKKDQKVELTAPSDEQAESWYETFAYGGCEKDE
jgi:hypothetical protein